MTIVSSLPSGLGIVGATVTVPSPRSLSVVPKGSPVIQLTAESSARLDVVGPPSLLGLTVPSGTVGPLATESRDS